MQVLYVVDLDLQPAEAHDAFGEAVNVFEIALEDMAQWLDPEGGVLTKTSLKSDGRLQLAPNRFGRARDVVWQAVKAGNSKAVRLDVYDRDVKGGNFTTRVVLSELQERVAVRVSMARETASARLLPAAVPDLRQPGILERLVRDSRVAVRVQGQRQDARFLQLRSDAEVALLAEVLHDDRRLPILLVHTRTLAAVACSRVAATRLVGLVQVVTLDLRAARSLAVAVPSAIIPFAGARLVWSSLVAPGVDFDAEVVNSGDPDVLRDRLMRLIAPLSVLTRGPERAFRRIRQDALLEQQRSAQERSNQAVAAGDVIAQVEALRRQLDIASDEARQWEDLAAEVEEELGQLRPQAERVAGLEQQVKQLTVALVASPSAELVPVQVEDPWKALPELESGDETSARELYLQLEDLSQGRIVFTDRAATSWKKAKYPFPGEMQEALVQLARVAITLYDGTSRNLGHLDTWIREEFGLKVSMSDDEIEKRPKLRDFVYEDTIYNRTPHVKVRDAAPRQQVGRVHFALDADRQRIVVDWVAVKLHSGGY